MTLRPFSAAATLALAACGAASETPKPDHILVVPASAAREAASDQRGSPQLAAVASKHSVPTLTVEESAQIATSEMWSEPIPADAEELVIE